MSKTDFRKDLEDVAYLAMAAAVPQMQAINAGEMSVKVSITATNGTRYRCSIKVVELDSEGTSNT